MNSWIIKDLGRDLAILGPSDILWAYTIISCVFAIAATIPVVAYQTWEFIASALTKEERKVTQNVYPRIIHFVYCRNLFWILSVIFHCAGIFNKYVSSD
ncbi:twin-arginine translocase subunit TatC [Peribacillus frigoritolerans]|uniref:twin-arginine translocase subunit TatC n=1 Tax=Peribacillus castrilensis TaxID=2897690 RepID=UPI003DA28CD2